MSEMNQNLIKDCRTTLYESEEEPDQMKWIDMTERLCDALEKMDKKYEELLEATGYGA